MAKRPEDRYTSALEFARALQRVQIGHGMQPTPIDVVEEEFAAPQHDEGEEETRFRGILRIDAQSHGGLVARLQLATARDLLVAVLRTPESDTQAQVRVLAHSEPPDS